MDILKLLTLQISILLLHKASSMSIHTSRRQLVQTQHERDELQNAVLQALLYPNHVLNEEEQSEVKKNVTWEDSAKQLSNDFEQNLIETSNATGTDYSTNSLMMLGEERHTLDPTPLYSIYGGPEGVRRHLYGQGVSLRDKRPLPVRGWNAPAVSALGSGRPEPGQQGAILPRIIQDNNLQKFLLAVQHSVEADTTDPVVTSQPVSVAGLSNEEGHKTERLAMNILERYKQNYGKENTRVSRRSFKRRPEPYL